MAPSADFVGDLMEKLSVSFKTPKRHPYFTFYKQIFENIHVYD
jgi:hypothetical protein